MRGNDYRYSCKILLENELHRLYGRRSAATRRPDRRVTRGKPRSIGVQAGRDQPRPSRPRKSSAHTNSQSATAPALMPNTNTGL